MNDRVRTGASFRDPSGFLFRRGGVLFRQVNHAYAPHYARVMESGLYERLTQSGLLIPHREVDAAPAEPSLAFKILQPDTLPFVSYPYEWPFSLFKDAALATLSIQKHAMKAGMCLKDASAYNIQPVGGRPLLIDSLSFETYEEGSPWLAYRQFCQHFLAPLALMAHADVRLGQLMRVYIDGVPLDLASRLLPGRTRLSLGLLTHLHFHAQIQRKFADRPRDSRRVASGRISKAALMGLIENLENTTRALEWKPPSTEWGNYYGMTNYTPAAFDHKRELISSWLERVQPSFVWDLGANDGSFSRLASARDIRTVAFDIDPLAVERNYLQVRAGTEQNLLPLVLDLTNPSPALGWSNRERASLAERGPADMVFALALVHHLAISNNVPLPQLADFLYDMGRWLIVEFVPKSDSQVQKLLFNRADIFHEYTQSHFEDALEQVFTIHERTPIQESERFLYLMERKATR